MSKTIAVFLSGCGVYDGSEIHETVLTLLAIEKLGASYQCFAPDVTQHHVIDHLSGEPTDESRNVLRESARIARGKVKALSEFASADFAAVVLPGGFGVAKNLSNFAFSGADCSINQELETALRATHKANKPIAALCIAPVILAKLFDTPELTIGNDPDTVAAIKSMGATHKTTTHAEVVVDEKNRLVTTPCYMLDATVSQIAEGATAAIEQLLRLA